MGGVHTKKVRKAEEKKLEPRFSKQIEKMGGQCLKFFPIFNTGWPDRFILMPGGFFFMAEIKSEGKELSPKQKARVKRARKLGFTVFVIDDDISLWYSINMIKYKIAG